MVSNLIAIQRLTEEYTRHQFKYTLNVTESQISFRFEFVDRAGNVLDSEETNTTNNSNGVAEVAMMINRANKFYNNIDKGPTDVVESPSASTGLHSAPETKDVQQLVLHEVKGFKNLKTLIVRVLSILITWYSGLLGLQFGKEKVESLVSSCVGFLTKHWVKLLVIFVGIPMILFTVLVALEIIFG